MLWWMGSLKHSDADVASDIMSKESQASTSYKDICFGRRPNVLHLWCGFSCGTWSDGS
jgi:hypothetical protein